MKTKIKHTVCLMVTCFFLAPSVWAQQSQTVATSGGFFENSEGSLAFTIGEIINENVFRSSVVLTQGFQQPQFGISSEEELTAESSGFIVYPNPTSGNLTLLSDIITDVGIRLVEPSGKVIHQQEVQNRSTELSLDGLASGQYILQINLQSRPAKIIKIIKY